MPTLGADSDEAKRIDAALQEWRQGDLALDESWFVHIGDPRVPLSAAAAEAEDEGDFQALTSEVVGLIVLSQTCDIVRACVDRPYVEIAPLVQVAEDDLQLVKRGRRPAYATLPTLEPSRLVADLDRTMTVEKSLVAGWKRTAGWATDADGRAFARALARKRVRFAFPDDFTGLVDKLQRRLIDKHAKDSVEGRALRSLREIRVRVEPSWDAAAVDVLFWFLRAEDETLFEGTGWPDLLSAWLQLVPASGRFKTVEGLVVVLEEMTARDYVESDPLDLDHLSTGAKE